MSTPIFDELSEKFSPQNDQKDTGEPPARSAESDQVTPPAEEHGPASRHVA